MKTAALPEKPPEVVVGVGECRLGSEPVRTLVTFALGSCMGLTAWDWKLRVGGLLHVMLPDSTASLASRTSRSNLFMYVDTAVPEFLRQLEIRGVRRERLRCSLAGGANMMASSTSLQIGKRNHLAMKQACWSHGMFVENEDVGGTDSRSVRLHLRTGRVDLRTGSREHRRLLAEYSIVGAAHGD